MDQPIRTVNVHEGAKLSQAGDSPRADITFCELVQQTLLEGLAGFLQRLSLRKDQPATLAIHLNDSDVYGFSHHFAPTLLRGFACGARAPHQAHLRGRHKAAQTTNGNDQAALVVAHNLAVIDLF